MKLKHTGPTGIVVFTSSLDEAPDNVFIQFNYRNHGELEILKYQLKNAQMVVMLAKKVMLLRLVRFGYQTKVSGEHFKLRSLELKVGQLQEDKVLPPIVEALHFLEVSKDLELEQLFKEH